MDARSTSTPPPIPAARRRWATASAGTNPGATAIGTANELPLAYDPDADARSWAEMKAFFEQLFPTG